MGGESICEYYMTKTPGKGVGVLFPGLRLYVAFEGLH